MFQQKYTSLSLNLSLSTVHHLCPKTNFMHSSNQIQHETKLHHSCAWIRRNCTPTQCIFNWNRLITGQHLTDNHCTTNAKVRGFFFIYTWVRALWIEFNNCPTRCDLFSLLHFCRQLYMFWVLTPIIRSSYNCNCSFWYWLTRSTTMCSPWVGTDSCVSYGRYSFLTNNYLPYNTHESVPTQQRERTLVDPINPLKPNL